MTARAQTGSICVKESPIHGKGVFALTPIRSGRRIIEYTGVRVTPDEAIRRSGQDPANPHHTFFFGLADGSLIDGGDQGNDARWINHGCEPNCEAREDRGRIFIVALRNIKPGEELKYDYRIDLPDEQSASLKKSYECRCGAPACRKTMLGDGPPVSTRQFVILNEDEEVVLKAHEPSGCAAALATILCFEHGIATHEREVAGHLAKPRGRQNKAGAAPSFLDLRRAASAYGLRARQCRDLDVSRLADLAPAIIQIKLKASTHFSVFRGVLDGHAMLADPVYGNLAMTLPKFSRAWQQRAALVF